MLDIPRVVSAYECGKCGKLFRYEDREEALEHTRVPILEFPVGFTMRGVNSSGASYGFTVVANSRLNQDHRVNHQVLDFPESRIFDICIREYSSRSLKDAINSGFYRIVDEEGLEKLSKMKEFILQQSRLRELITDPAEVSFLKS